MSTRALNDDAVGAALTDAMAAVTDALLFVHTTPWELDEAMVGFGFSEGACEAQDSQGLIRLLARRAHRPHQELWQDSPVLERMVSEGRQGRTAGVGWYRYPGGGGLVIDPLVEDLLREEAWFAGVTRTELDGPELISAVVAGLVNVLAHVLPLRDPQIAQQVNTASLSVPGFPVKRGGLLQTADQIGAGVICAKLQDLAASGPAGVWTPAPYLTGLAREAGKTMPD
ncbi:3-hydroxyacyl-CoA dehydrogenase family protein [uncultured Roseobacter sp.]|uniref:3-hydroxyacyl-CoA dehydrogenase family protein n=1 Tax=uncultured Roseobacter sp. TaxID=114847 RepID=UPI0026077B7E|nr:3-hydroxyacyl-CoA dehydrogenase family protein [uncultured Roseobacter sp.]